MGPLWLHSVSLRAARRVLWQGACVGRWNCWKRSMNTSGSWVGGLDIGTQSARLVIFDEEGRCVAQEQKDIPCVYPNKGWVEQDPDLLIATSREVMEATVQSLVQQKLLQHPTQLGERLRGIGITNQRETTILWDSETGEALYPAIGASIQSVLSVLIPFSVERRSLSARTTSDGGEDE